MRDGARPLLFWALLLTATATLNAIWAGISIQTATFGAAILVIVVVALAVLVRPRHSGPEPVTQASFAAMIVAVGFAALLFGLTFGHFLIYFGAGLMVAGIGRLLVELHHQRRAMRGGGS